MLTPVTLQERVSNAMVVVEGEVIHQKSFWNKEQNNIFTLNRVKPKKVFNWKANTSYSQEFYIVTAGGVIGNTMQKVTATTELKIGDVGVFFGQPSRNEIAGAEFSTQLSQFECVAGPLGFIHFDDNKQYGHDAFDKYLIAPDLYDVLTRLTGKNFIEVGSYEEPLPTTNMAPTITSFSPDSLSAGTKSVLTITGTNFGSTRGSSRVRFRDANNGGSGLFDPEDDEYISWSDTEIRVEVTRRAGTGKFTIDNGSGTVQSATDLVITFAQLNVVPQSGGVFQPKHIGENGDGYTWQFFTDFDNDADAKQSFLRAFQSWRCGTLINWDIGSVSTIDVIARDNVNIVRFDNGSELPNNVLGRCSSWWSGCTSGGTTRWYVAELDIVFNDGTNWHYGTNTPPNNRYDFESVAIHELGHGHQLGHVIKSSEIMHFSIGPKQVKRILSTEGDLGGGNYVMNLNLQGGICGRNVMKALDPNFCSLIPVAGFSSTATTLCPNNNIIFSDTSKGSTNAFNWNFGVGATPATATGKGPHTVSYSSAGKKTVQLIVEGVIGNDTVTKTDLVTVDPPRPAPPTAIIGSDTACIGGQTYAVDAVTNATTYLWGVNGGGTVNASTDSFTTVTFNASTATADVWVKASNSCGTSDSIIKTIPVIDGPTSDFSFNVAGDTIELSSLAQNANSILWKFPDGQTANFQNLNFIPAQSGTFNIKLLATNFCGTDSIEKSINFIKVSISEITNKVGLKIYPNPFSNATTISFDANGKYGILSFEIYDLLGQKVMSYALVQPKTTINRDFLKSGVYIYKAKGGGETLATGRLVVK
jgi:PKD repeat protein